MKRPEIKKYESVPEFFRDWFAFLKQLDPKFSIRHISRETKVSVGYLSSLQSGKLNPSEKALKKILPSLRLYPSEESYLSTWSATQNSKKPNKTAQAFKKLGKFKSFQQSHPGDVAALRYLSNWHYLAIRELADCDDFKEDTDWIQKRLKWSVSKVEIKRALNFLFKYNLLNKGPDGAVKKPELTLDCRTGVFEAGLMNLHLQLLEKATQSLISDPQENRHFEGLTVGLSNKDLPKAKQILSRALDELSELSKSTGNSSDEVFQIEMALFSLTQTSTNKSKVSL